MSAAASAASQRLRREKIIDASSQTDNVFQMGFRPARRQQPKGRMGSACQEMCIQTLGEREPGTERLEQAVTAYRLALEECTRERVPLEWAKTQTNLGTALQLGFPG
jgi:hypothetical protein